MVITYRKVIVALLFIACFLLLYFDIYGVEDNYDNKKEVVNQIKIINVESDPATLRFNNKFNLINEIAPMVATEHEYVLGRYDCTQFSEELVKRINSYNISSYCVAGYIQTDDYRKLSHTWVEINDTDLGIIEIEATNGQIIDNDTFETYHIIRRRLCW